TLMQTRSDSINTSTRARKVGNTRSNESGKLIPSRRGHESQVAACGSHSAGMRYPSAAGKVIQVLDEPCVATRAAVEIPPPRAKSYCRHNARRVFARRASVPNQDRARRQYG